MNKIQKVDADAIAVLRAEPGLLLPGRSLERVVDAALARGNLGFGAKANAKAADLIKKNRNFSTVENRMLPGGRLLSVCSFPTGEGGFFTTYRELDVTAEGSTEASTAERDTDERLLADLITAAGHKNIAQPLSVHLLKRYGNLGRILSSIQRDKGSNNLPPEAVKLLDLVSRTMTHTLRSNLEGRKIIKEPAALTDYLLVRLASETEELSLALYLNASNHLLSDEVIARGGVLNCPTDPKTVVRRSLDLGATAVILVHNHPSGDPKPSRGDKVETRRFEIALSALDIKLVDSIIVGKMGLFSFRSSGLLYSQQSDRVASRN